MKSNIKLILFITIFSIGGYILYRYINKNKGNILESNIKEIQKQKLEMEQQGANLLQQKLKQEQEKIQKQKLEMEQQTVNLLQQKLKQEKIQKEKEIRLQKEKEIQLQKEKEIRLQKEKEIQKKKEEKIYNNLDISNIDKNDIIKNFFNQPIEYIIDTDKKINKKINYKKKNILEKDINVINAEILFDLDRKYTYYDDENVIKELNTKDFKLDIKPEEKKLVERFFYDQKNYLKNMSPVNKNIINTYIQEAYTLYNRFLRKEKDIVDRNFTSDNTLKDLYKLDKTLFDITNPRKTMNNLSKNLNQIILNAPKLPIQLATFRASVDPYYFNNLEAVTNENGQTEYIYTSPGFLSTAFGLYRTTTFQPHFLNRDQTCCLSVIYLPKGTRGLYLYNNYETEFLLPLNSRLQYLGEKQMTIDELQTLTKYQSLQYPELSQVLNRSKTMTVYEWLYLPPLTDEYIELYRFT